MIQQTLITPISLAFLSKNSRNFPGISCVFIKNKRNTPGISCVFIKNSWNSPGISCVFIKNSRNSPGISHVFITNKRLSSPRTGNLRPVGVRIKFGTTQNGLKQTFINKELCNFSYFQVNVKSYDNFSLFVRWMKTKNGCTDVLVHPFFSIRFAGLILRNILQNIQQMIPNHLHRWNEQTLVRSVDVAQGRAKADHV